VPLKPDAAVEWILQAHHNLGSHKYDIKVVPVSIIYERLFDASLLATEMVSGKFQNLNFLQLMLLIYKMPRNKLGNCYVKYSEPIDLNTFVNQNKDLKFQDRAMKLTKDLL